MGLTTASLRAGIGRLRRHMNDVAQELCALDGELGDGDLGVTLSKAFNRLDEIAAGLPDDLGQAFAQSAQGVAKVSSSSFGTLLAVSLLAIARQAGGRTEVDWAELPDFVALARDTISQRGRSQLGQKTVIDALDAAAGAMRAQTAPDAMLAAGLAGVRDKIAAMRGQPAQVGRARIFAEKSAGLDDPGMRAFEAMLVGLERPAS